MLAELTHAFTSSALHVAAALLAALTMLSAIRTSLDLSLS